MGFPGDMALAYLVLVLVLGVCFTFSIFFVLCFGVFLLAPFLIRILIVSRVDSAFCLNAF